MLQVVAVIKCHRPLSRVHQPLRMLHRQTYFPPDNNRKASGLFGMFRCRNRWEGLFIYLFIYFLTGTDLYHANLLASHTFGVETQWWPAHVTGCDHGR